MSVFLSDGIEEAGAVVSDLLRQVGPDYMICSITVRELRELGEDVARSHNDFFPGHANCKNANGQRTGSVRKKMARQAKWEPS